MEILKTLLLAFIPLFVAIDVLAVVPLFITLTDGLSETEKRKMITQSTFAVLCIAILFLFLGRLLFRFLGITENDFRIGGGVLLLAISVTDLLYSRMDRRRKPETGVGIVPIGIPLIIGPAALTTILILVDNYGYIFTLISLLMNLAIVWIVFRNSQFIIKILGKNGANAMGRIMAIFLAAIAVMMIRIGIQNIIFQ
jgi:multiple antibiotic resistance protein